MSTVILPVVTHQENSVKRVIISTLSEVNHIVSLPSKGNSLQIDVPAICLSMAIFDLKPNQSHSCEV